MYFPREMWAGSQMKGAINPPRKVVENKDEYVDFIKAYNGKMNLYTSVYDYEFFSENRGLEYSIILDRIFLDFDAHDKPLDKARDDCKRLHEWLLKQDYKHTVAFSGRGFHIFVFGERVKSLRRIKSFFNLCNDVLGKSEFLDPAVINTARLRRIQNTYHMGANCFCIPIRSEDLNLTIEELKEKAKKPSPVTQKEYGKILVNWPEVKHMEIAEVEIDSVESPGVLPILPCLKNAVMAENPNHRARYLLVQWYNEMLSELAVLDNDLNCTPREVQGAALDNIQAMIEEEIKTIADNENIWIDYNAFESRKHVRYIVRKRFMAPSCDTLIQEGLCVGKCWRYTE